MQRNRCHRGLFHQPGLAQVLASVQVQGLVQVQVQVQVQGLVSGSGQASALASVQPLPGR